MKPVSDLTLVSELGKSEGPVVIKFEAKWGPSFQFFTANVEHSQLITQRYQVSQIPAMLAIEKGVVLAKRVGSGSKQEIVQWMVQAIPGLRNER
jgi:thioredoxin 1